MPEQTQQHIQSLTLHLTNQLSDDYSNILNGSGEAMMFQLKFYDSPQAAIAAISATIEKYVMDHWPK